MTYRFSVAIGTLKGFRRVYLTDGNVTLGDFHAQMEADLELPRDQTVLFKAIDAKGRVIARYASFNIGDGSISDVTVSQAVKKGAAEFVYFYDTINKYSLRILLEGTSDEGCNGIELVFPESKGPNPQAFNEGFVAFEDLPPEQQAILRKNIDEGDDEDEEEKGDEEESIFGEDEIQTDEDEQ